MDQHSEQSNKPKLCVNGCGFFGSPVNEDMCSKCFKTLQKKDEPKPEKKQLQPKETFVEKKTEQSNPTIQEKPKEEEKTIQKDTTRCFSCNKRVGLTGIKCKCEFVFCGKHRYAEAHDCTFNYKTEGRDILRNQMPVVMASKVEKI